MELAHMNIDTETVVRLARDIRATPGPDLATAVWPVYDRMSPRRTVALTPPPPEQSLMRLIVQAAGDDHQDELADCLDDIRGFALSRDWHVEHPETHSECCESLACERGDCRSEQRGPACEEYPREALDYAVRTLLDVLRARLGGGRVDGLLTQGVAA